MCLCYSTQQRYSSSDGIQTFQCIIQNALRFPQVVSFKWNKKKLKQFWLLKTTFLETNLDKFQVKKKLNASFTDTLKHILISIPSKSQLYDSVDQLKKCQIM